MSRILLITMAAGLIAGQVLAQDQAQPEKVPAKPEAAEKPGGLPKMPFVTVNRKEKYIDVEGTDL